MKNNKFHFQDLMLYRIHEILLVASPYDAFILEEDGKLTEQILSEYLGMNLSYAPRVWNAPSANIADQMLKKRFFDIIIVMMRISDIDPINFSEELKKRYPKKPIVLLAFDQSEIKYISYKNQQIFDEIFIWSGNSNVFPAIIKSIEDKHNIKTDVETAGVRSILFIEDTPRFYSSILPVLYKEIIHNTKQLIDKSLSSSQKLLHMRARPKIILVKTYEDAIKFIKKYRYNILGIISDLKFPNKGKENLYSGIKLIEFMEKIESDIPLILQTTEKDTNPIEKKYNIKVLDKNSPQLFKNLTEFMLNNLGFGDFNFRLPTGKVIKKVSTINQLMESIKNVPGESLEFHASKNHLSNWLSTRGEFDLASNFRKLKRPDFPSIEHRRKHHLNLLKKAKPERDAPTIIQYSSVKKDLNHDFIQIGSGSLGGKARGLAFANNLLINDNFKKKFSDIKVRVPKIIAIATNEFDEFMESNNLWITALGNYSNKKIVDKFLCAKLSKRLVKDLKKLIKKITYPLAVRSSSLLEDSQYQPLAGMYSTFMLPNSHIEEEERYNQLCETIKRIYASTFFQGPKSLMDNIIHRHEEEKMGVIIMELAGQKHNDIFYPTFSGVAQSYNYYPVSYMKRKEGVIFTALGLGKTIVDGEKSLRFSPKHPDIFPQYYSTKSMINNSQNTFYALDMKKGASPLKHGETKNLKKYDLSVAEKDNQLKYSGSVITKDNILRDSLNYDGVRVITFAKILKFNQFPLKDILTYLLKIGEKSLGCPIELEFAVNIDEKNNINEFCLLQIKPMVIGSKKEKINISSFKDHSSLVCYSKQVLGDGEIEGVSHIMYVDLETFKRNKTEKIAKEIGEINNKSGRKKPYVLFGPGRWGTADPWLGIPANWEQITNAKMIVEIGIDELNPDPSFGSHFFQNISNLRIGYFTINKKYQNKYIDWDWIKTQPVKYKTKYVKMIELKKPLYIKIDGMRGNGIILKEPLKKKQKMDEEESPGI